jgi:hypothetical protein
MFFTRLSKLGLSAVLLVLATTTMLMAHAPSGAIFTTLANGSEVNFNIYPSKEAVYLDGGPGIGAPQTAAGLDDGTYVFQVTDPSGKTLLSTDPAQCRQFTAKNGVINAVVITGCQHSTGVDVDHAAVTVQLFPYLDTPNNGGVYKAWVVFLEDFLAGCADLGVANGLAVVDCGTTPGNQHGFIPRHTKTDNFKVGKVSNLEIDTRFTSSKGVPLDGMGLIWGDTQGATNIKFSYYKPENLIDHFAHIEAVEVGVHQITIQNQQGCNVKRIERWDSKKQTTFVVSYGPATIDVSVRQNDPEWTKYLYVFCQ